MWHSMTRYLLCVAVLGAVAHAQPPLVEPCGGVGSCVRVGTTDGGQVQLGGAAQTSRYSQSDGGANRVRFQPLSPITGVEIVGNQPRTGAQPDVIIGGLNARDGGQGPIVSIRTGTYEIARFNTAGLVVNGTTSGGAQTVSSLAVTGNATVGGTLGVTGVTTLVVLDAGVNSKIGGRMIAVGRAQDGGATTPLMQWGDGPLVADELAVTYTTAFANNPSCVCSHTQTTNTNACGVKTGTAPSTTAVTFAVASGGTDVVFWQCMGDL